MCVVDVCVMLSALDVAHASRAQRCVQQLEMCLGWEVEGADAMHGDPPFVCRSACWVGAKERGMTLAQEGAARPLAWLKFAEAELGSACTVCVDSDEQYISNGWSRGHFAFFKGNGLNSGHPQPAD